MNKKLILLLFACILLGAVSCAGAGNVDTAVQYIDALNNRDIDAARELVCESYEDDVTMGLTTVDDPVVEPFSFSNVSCSARGSDAACRFTIAQQTESADVGGIEQNRSVIFKFEDGKVCGFDEQVAQ